MTATASFLAPIPDAQHREVAGVQIDFLQAGNARVKRVVYPIGFRWSRDMKPLVGTQLCQHSHVGFLAQGVLQVKFADGFEETLTAPRLVAIEPGHDGWVLGEDPVVLIEFDFEAETVEKMNLPIFHGNAAPA